MIMTIKFNLKYTIMSKSLPFAPYKVLVEGILHHYLQDYIYDFRRYGPSIPLMSKRLTKIAICVYLLKLKELSDISLISLTLVEKANLSFEIFREVDRIKLLPFPSLKDLILDFSY